MRREQAVVERSAAALPASAKLIQSDERGIPLQRALSRPGCWLLGRNPNRTEDPESAARGQKSRASRRLLWLCLRVAVMLDYSRLSKTPTPYRSIPLCQRSKPRRKVHIDFTGLRT